jgi:hypothetical protein
VIDFLKKHYEKIVLCLVLLGLAGAALRMSSVIQAVRDQLQPIDTTPPAKTAPVPPVDISADEKALQQITNPPAVVLSGEHNLFNPVTWQRRANGELIKIIKTGPDALVVTNIVPLYTIITYDRPTGSPVYVMTWLQHSDLRLNRRGTVEHSHLNEKAKGVPYIVRGIKGADNDPSEINLEIIDTGDTNVWVSTNTPYKRVDSYMADLKYDPEPQLALTKKLVNDRFKLDNDPYKIVDITNNAVRVQSERTTKVTEIKLTQSP